MLSAVVVWFGIMPNPDELDQVARPVEAIAEVELTGVPLEDAMLRMLDTVRAVLSVDTAVVLLADPAGTHLEAFAARGRGRSPSGVPDAGGRRVRRQDRRIAWSGCARRGARRRRGQPAAAAQGAAVDVGRPARRRRQPARGVAHRITDTSSLHRRGRGALQLAGERIAHVILSDQTTTELTTAWALQRSLLPGRLPEVDGLEFASRFVPARSTGVGGDWFDAFLLPSGAVGIVMGDVVGSGLRAAVVMGRLRSSLRSYALEFSDPAAVLNRLNRKIMHFEPGEMATVLYLVLAPDHTHLTLASAGHPPPIAARPNTDPVFLEVRPSPPIGVDSSTQHTNVHHDLEPDMAVAVYTDGLFERRTVPIDEQLERLRKSVHAGPPQLVVSDIMDEMVGTHIVGDDTALLVFRRGV